MGCGGSRKSLSAPCRIPVSPFVVMVRRAQPDGQVLVTDGPYIESKEHVGGFWILETADLEEALAWGRKAAKACRAPVEVRAILQKPAVSTR